MLTVLLIIGSVAVAGSLLFGSDGLTRLLQLRTLRQQLGEAAVAQLQANAALREQIARLEKDPRYLESVARKQLGLLRPDEIVYRFRRPTDGAP